MMQILIKLRDGDELHTTIEPESYEWLRRDIENAENVVKIGDAIIRTHMIEYVVPIHGRTRVHKFEPPQLIAVSPDSHPYEDEATHARTADAVRIEGDWSQDSFDKIKERVREIETAELPEDDATQS